MDWNLLCSVSCVRVCIFGVVVVPCMMCVVCCWLRDVLCLVSRRAVVCCLLLVACSVPCVA